MCIYKVTPINEINVCNYKIRFFQEMRVYQKSLILPGNKFLCVPLQKSHYNPFRVSLCQGSIVVIYVNASSFHQLQNHSAVLVQ